MSVLCLLNICFKYNCVVSPQDGVFFLNAHLEAFHSFTATTSSVKRIYICVGFITLECLGKIHDVIVYNK